MIFWVGLGSVAVPIVIHLLNRRRFRLMDWAAMQFLLESVRRNRRRLRIEELILLAIRCLVLFLLGLALARFTGCQAMDALPGGTESQTIVFVLDDSYSMGQRVGAGTVFSSATTDVTNQIKRLRQRAGGDKVAIVLTSEAESDEPFFKLTHVANAEMERLSARLSGLTVSDGRARLAQALAKAERIFKADKSVVRRLYLYGDFRQADLTAARAGDAIAEQFEQFREQKVDVVALDFGRRPANNLTIESMEMINKFAVAGVPIRVRLGVRNHGQAIAKDVEVALKAKINTKEGLKEVELPSGAIETIDRRGTGRVEFDVICPLAGPAIITAALAPDELAGDDRAYLALDVRDAVHVLAVDGRPDLSDPTESESFLFVNALDPDGDGGEGAKVDVVSPSAMADVPVAEYDLVALLNVGGFPMLLDSNEADGTTVERYPQVEAMLEFVKSGGGLVIFTGDQVDTTFYNGPMYANGSGLSPYRIGPHNGDPEKREQFFRLDPKSLAADSVLMSFHNYLADGADPTRFIRFYAFNRSVAMAPPSTSPEIKPPRVLARFADEDHSPAIVARQIGRGMVLMFYTSPTMAWNDWPAGDLGTYVAVLNDMLAYLAKPQEQSLSARVGEPIVFPVPEALHDAKAALKTPLHPTQPVVPLMPVQPDEGRTETRSLLRYDRADLAGQYALELSMPDETVRQVLFARTTDPAEGDLTCGREPALATALGSEEFTYVDRTASRPDEVETAGMSKEYWTLALAVLALLLAAETFLGQRFGHYPQSGEKRR